MLQLLFLKYQTYLTILEFDYLFFFRWVWGGPIVLFQVKRKNRRSKQRIINGNEEEPVVAYKNEPTNSDEKF